MFNDSVSCSRSGTVFGSFDTLLVVGSGSVFYSDDGQFDHLSVRNRFQDFLGVGNWAELQIDVNAER